MAFSPWFIQAQTQRSPKDSLRGQRYWPRPSLRRLRRNASARWVADHADGLSESPLESLARGCLLAAGLSAPELQVWIGQAGARVDMLYRDQRVVIEADGMVKYTNPAALRDEKRRQERLERLGYRVVRVTWDDILRYPAETVGRVRAAFARRR